MKGQKLITKQETLKKREQYLLQEIGPAIANKVKMVENLIDDTIMSTGYGREHSVGLDKICNEIGIPAGFDFSFESKSIIQILICKYESAGWSISLSDGLFILS